MVTVEMMARCREERRYRQLELIKRHHLPCLSFTLNIPGPVKDGEKIRKIHQAGINAVEKVFSGDIIEFFTEGGETGPEAYFSIDLDGKSLKSKTVQIEESHRFGRIFDLDVIGRDGKSLSRRDLGLSPRKCLICPEEAAVCARSRAHTLEEMLEKIDLIAGEI